MKNKLIFLIVFLFLVLPFCSSVFATDKLPNHVILTLQDNNTDNKSNIPDLNFESMAKSVNNKNNFSSYEDMIKRVENRDRIIENLLNQMKKDNGTMNLSSMMELQFRMQMMSQYVEAVSNLMTEVHNAMMTLIRGIKGQ